MPHARHEGSTAQTCTCEVVVDRLDQPMGGRRTARVQMGNRTILAVQPLDITESAAREISAILTEVAREKCGGRCQTSRAPARHLLAV